MHNKVWDEIIYSRRNFNAHTASLYGAQRRTQTSCRPQMDPMLAPWTLLRVAMQVGRKDCMVAGVTSRYV